MIYFQKIKFASTSLASRPFFTYWITTVQILVTIISLYTYGVGPWGIGLTERTADVLHTTVTLKRVSIYVQQNIWLGPKFVSLSAFTFSRITKSEKKRIEEANWLLIKNERDG